MILVEDYALFVGYFTVKNKGVDYPYIFSMYEWFGVFYRWFYWQVYRRKITLIYK